MKIVGIVPARLESKRLPRKALADIGGLPMVIHTCKRAGLVKSLDDVYLATDSEVIKETAERHGIKVIMTGAHHQTGSDRLAEACKKIDCDIVVNIQGDEALLNPEHVDKVVEALIEDAALQVAVLVTPYSAKDSSSDIKAVFDLNHNILYFSRTDLPSDARSPVTSMWKVCFIVPFRKNFLLTYGSWEQTPLEKIEFNEYLRILEHGYKIRAVPVDRACISVDTPEDLVKVRALMTQDTIKEKYMR